MVPERKATLGRTSATSWGRRRALAEPAWARQAGNRGAGVPWPEPVVPGDVSRRVGEPGSSRRRDDPGRTRAAPVNFTADGRTERDELRGEPASGGARATIDLTARVPQATTRLFSPGVQRGRDRTSVRSSAGPRILSDPQEKQAYVLSIPSGPRPRPFGSPAWGSCGRFRQVRDIFNRFFGGSRRRQRRAARRQLNLRSTSGSPSRGIKNREGNRVPVLGDARPVPDRREAGDGGGDLSQCNGHGEVGPSATCSGRWSTSRPARVAGGGKLVETPCRRAAATAGPKAETIRVTRRHRRGPPDPPPVQRGEVGPRGSRGQPVCRGSRHATAQREARAHLEARSRSPGGLGTDLVPTVDDRGRVKPGTQPGRRSAPRPGVPPPAPGARRPPRHRRCCVSTRLSKRSAGPARLRGGGRRDRHQAAKSVRSGRSADAEPRGGWFEAHWEERAARRPGWAFAVRPTSRPSGRQRDLAGWRPAGPAWSQRTAGGRGARGAGGHDRPAIVRLRPGSRRRQRAEPRWRRRRSAISRPSGCVGSSDRLRGTGRNAQPTRSSDRAAAHPPLAAHRAGR